jgi:hypothetical protein
VRARQVADKAARRRAAIQLGIEERQRLQEEEQEVARLEAEARSEVQRCALKQRLDMEAKVLPHNNSTMLVPSSALVLTMHKQRQSHTSKRVQRASRVCLTERYSDSIVTIFGVCLCCSSHVMFTLLPQTHMFRR